MNKRIEELIKICTERVPYYPAGNDGHPEYNIEFNKQKFAELLIKECISVACTADNGDEVYAWYAIQQHFGIKE